MNNMIDAKLITRLFENAKEKAKLEEKVEDQYVSVNIIFRGDVETIEVVVDDEFQFEIIDKTLWCMHVYNAIYYSHVINLNDVVSITDEV